MMRRTMPLTVAAIAWFALAAVAPAAHGSEALAAKAGCGMCHAFARKGIGPSYREMADRYKDTPGARQLLVERVRKGSQGVWGKVPMTPIGPGLIDDADLETVIDWILKQYSPGAP